MGRKKTVKTDPFEIEQMGHNIKLERKHKLSAKQQAILKKIWDDKTGIVIIDGPAGTAKTYTAIYGALQEVKEKGKQLLYLRSLAESSQYRMGALPGTLYEKFDPFTDPLDDKLHEFLSPVDISYLREHVLVDMKPINYLRGADWKSKIVVIDEAQNLTRENLLTALTRAGEGTKVILCGDLMQSDIKESGYQEVCDKFNDKKSEKMGIYHFCFGVEDIVRSELVKFIVTKFHEQ
jgi:phosphate starvation-inducible PhoH-like protein